jgi:hypothetical protein
MPSLVPGTNSTATSNANLQRDRMTIRRRASWTAVWGEPLVIVLAAISVALMFAVILRNPDKSQADFYTFWDAAHWYREGTDPYLGHPLRVGAGYNLNAPAFILLFLPFSYLPLRVAFVAWTLAGFFAYWLASRWITRELALSSSFLVFCGLLISQASFSAFQLGQVAPLLVPVFTWAWIADRADRPWTSGILLGTLIAAKPFLGVFGIYALLYRRSRPLVFGLVVGAAAFWTLGLLVGGISAYRSWLYALTRVTWPAHLANGSLLAVVSRELTAPPRLIPVTPLAVRPEWVTPIWTLMLVVVASGALWSLRRLTNRDRAWLLVGCCGLLLSPLGWVYYAPLLSGPVIGRWQTGSQVARTLLAVGYACFCVPYSWLVQPHAAVTTFLAGSAYTWGFLSWFAAAISFDQDGR